MLRKALVVLPAVVAAGMLSVPLAHADPPVAGQQCMNWHATATYVNGNTMTCTHTADSGHLIYWEIGGAQDIAWVVTR
jgi:hypothetical protein